MSGIILLLVLSIWVYLATIITRFVVRKMKPGKYRYLVNVIVFVFIFIAPVIDDIIGGFQFRALCKSGGVPIYDKNNVQGRTIKYTSSGWGEVSNTIIPIQELTINWIDPVTEDALFTYKKYDADGGWLSRLIGFPEGSPPYTFNAVCGNRNNILLDKLNTTKLYK